MRTLSQEIDIPGYKSSDDNSLPDMTELPVSKWPSPPKFAIANHFFIGSLPEELLDATWAEMLMCSLITVIAQTHIMHGGQHCSIRSHLILFDAVPGPPATLLPIQLNQDTLYQIVLAGPSTDEQMARICKLHALHHGKVTDLLAFYKRCNQWYASIELNHSLLDSLPNDADDFVPEGVFEHASELSSHDAEAVDRQQASVGGYSGDLVCINDAETTAYLERSVLFMPTIANLTEQQEQETIDRYESKVTQQKSTLQSSNGQPQFEVRSSSKFANPIDPSIDAKTHPHLFPYGPGYSGEPNHRVSCSKLECTRHFSMLSSRRFAQDKYYGMTSFDRLSLERGYTHATMSCKARPSQHAAINAITSAELRQGIRNRRRRQTGRAPRFNQATTPAVQQMLRHVECSAAQVWGSNAERRWHRRNAFATCDAYGQPALFVTVTPKSDSTLAIAYYAGAVAVDSLFDANYREHMLSDMECRRLSLLDDMASARLFVRLVNAFLTVALGFDASKHLPHREGGLFGHVKAYYGMVETQGRGTLHMHLILWLYGAPRTTTECQQRKDNNVEYETMLLDYADSVVTNTLPVDVVGQSCASCGNSGPSFEQLPIPASAKQTPF